MLDDLRARGVKLHSLTEAIDTATPTGRAMWQMIGVLAELGKVAHLRTHTRRGEGRSTSRCEVWTKSETDCRTDQPREETARQGRSPPVCGRSPKRGPFDPLSGTEFVTAAVCSTLRRHSQLIHPHLLEADGSLVSTMIFRSADTPPRMPCLHAPSRLPKSSLARLTVCNLELGHLQPAGLFARRDESPVGS